MNPNQLFHAMIYSIGSLLVLFLLHHLPVNQLFIDPFSEAIKGHDLMDIAFSKFRDKKQPELYDSRIIIINSGITDREKLAHTLRYLKDQEVKAIGIDLLFDSLYAKPGDTLLRAAIQSFDRIVLGFTFNETRDHKGSSYDLRSDPFIRENTKEGYVNLASNDGLSVRAFEPFHQIDGETKIAFAVELASLYDPKIPDELRERDHEKEWINFKRLQPGSSNMRFPFNSNQAVHYTLIEMDRFLQDTVSLVAGTFKDKIILIGFNGEQPGALSMKDRYYTPMNEQYTGRSLPDMHGVVIHANIVSMLLDRDYIHDLHNNWIYLFSLLLFLINYMIFMSIHHLDVFRSLPYIRLVQVAQFFLILALCLSLLLHANVKMGFTFMATCVILSYEFYEAYEKKLQSRVDAWYEEALRWVQRGSLISKT